MYKKSAHELHQAFIEGRLTASEIAAGFLQRIQLLDGDIQAFLNVFSDRVMEKAEKLDRLKKIVTEEFGELENMPLIDGDGEEEKDNFKDLQLKDNKISSEKIEQKQSNEAKIDISKGLMPQKINT